MNSIAASIVALNQKLLGEAPRRHHGGIQAPGRSWIRTGAPQFPFPNSALRTIAVRIIGNNPDNTRQLFSPRANRQ